MVKLSNLQAQLAVFYHVYQAPGWQSLVNEQTFKIYRSGLLRASDFVWVGVNGNQQITLQDSKYIIEYHSPLWSEETPTLASLRDFCRINPGYKVLYLHTKGITQNTPEVTDWRHVMEYFCIENWRESIAQLSSHDAVGCLYMDDCYFGFFPHFSGNFWWANASYVNTLDHSFLVDGIRQNREFWIGTGVGSMFSFHNSGLNHYAHRYPKSKYCGY